MKKFFFFACALLMGMNVMAYEGVAYAWPNTTPDGTSLAGGVYVSYNGNRPDGEADYKAYDSSSRSDWASLYTAYFAAQAKDGYAFAGWFTNATYSQLITSNSVYDSKKANNNLTCYALFAASTVDSVRPYTTTIPDTIRTAGTYTATVKFEVSNADAPADFTMECISFEDWTITGQSVKNNVLTVTLTFNCDNSIKTYNSSVMLTVTSKGTNTGYEDGEKSFKSVVIPAVVDLDMVPVTIASSIAAAYHVGDSLDLTKAFTSNSSATMAYEMVSYVEGGINNEGGVTPSLENNWLKMGKAGVVVLKASQDESGAWNAAERFDTIAINKYANEVVWTIGDTQTDEWKLGFNDGAYVSAAVSNSAAEVTIEQLSGDEYATYYAEQGAIYSSFVTGVALLQASAEEDYLYEAASGIATITVAAADACDLYFKADQHDFTAYVYDPVYVYFEGIPESLIFDLRKRTYSNNGTFTITALYEDSTAVIVSSSLSNLSDSWSTITLPLDSDVIGIQFSAADFGPIAELYIKNIEVTSVSKMEADQEVIDFGHCKYATAAHDTLYTAMVNVDWITCDSIIRVESTLEHVSVSIDSIDARAYVGQTTIQIGYVSYVPETVEGKVVIYTPYESAEIIVKAITDDSATEAEQIEEAIEAEKVLNKGMLFIRRDNKLYNANGAVME